MGQYGFPEKRPGSHPTAIYEAWWHFRVDPEHLAFTPLTFAKARVLNARFTVDGKSAFFTWGGRWPADAVVQALSFDNPLPRAISSGVVAADWAPDGRGLAVVRDEGPAGMRVDYPEGKVLARVEGGWFSHLRFSPNGNHLAVVRHPVYMDDMGSVLVIETASALAPLSSTRFWRGPAVMSPGSISPTPMARSGPYPDWARTRWSA